jgi:hypothetical protein
MKKIKETPQMKRVRLRAIKNFRKAIKELGFRKMSEKEILENNKRLHLEFPKRVTADTHRQEQYICERRNGYQVVVITSLLNDRFMKTGRVWVQITEDGKRLWTRYFLKNQGYQSVLEKVLVYAQFAQNIVNNRPLCRKSDAWMDLYKEKESFMFQGVLKEKYVHSWKSDLTNYSFYQFFDSYVQDISLKKREIIFAKEYKTERYFKTRTTQRFANEIRSVAKITKPENSVTKK